MRFQKDISLYSPEDDFLKTPLLSGRFQCLSNRMANVSKLLDNTHALNGDKEGPVSREINRFSESNQHHQRLFRPNSTLTVH
jgi:hypothetical protein